MNYKINKVAINESVLLMQVGPPLPNTKRLIHNKIIIINKLNIKLTVAG